MAPSHTLVEDSIVRKKGLPIVEVLKFKKLRKPSWLRRGLAGLADPRHPLKVRRAWHQNLHANDAKSVAIFE